MAKITIRNVPDEVRDVLKARAARRHQSMQEYVLGELEHLASLPSVDEWLEEARALSANSDSTVTAADILQARDAGRA